MTNVERRATVVGMAAALSFTAFAVALRLGGGDWLLPSLPPRPRMERWEAFGLYAWLPWVMVLAAAAAVAGAIVRWVTGWQWPTRWVRGALPVLLCVETAVLYVPFYCWTVTRMDRLAGPVEEPAVFPRALAVSTIATLALAAVFLCVTGMRRTPERVRRAALTVTATLLALLLHLYWVNAVFPIPGNGWDPAVWQKPDLHVPARPCRGALLWWERDWKTIPVARIDDVWLRFADPRRGGAPVFAISAGGEWKPEYLWLTRDELRGFRVRRDDPALRDRDGRPRPELVRPAAWHHLGFEW